MSVLYPDLSFTNFPNTLDNIILKSNITNAMDAKLVEKIQEAIISGDFILASTILNSNPHLNGKIFSANDYNQIRDAILALERFYKDDIKNYVVQKQTEWNAEIDKFNFKGVYSPTEQYYKNNMVNYTTKEGTLLYLCTKTPPTGIEPTNTEYWRLFILKGERGTPGEGLAFTWIWNPMTEYGRNDVVVYENKWWISTKVNRGEVPSQGSIYWEVLLSSLPALQIPITSSQPTNQIDGDQWYEIL